MSTFDSDAHKSMGDGGNSTARKEYMHYAGAFEMRPELNKDVRDGINGSINLSEADVGAINAKAKSLIRILAEKDGTSIVTERKLHSNGKSFTLPLSDREDLGLEPDDEIEIWVDLVERDPDSKTQNGSSQQRLVEDEMDERLSVIFVGDTEYHFVEDEDVDETKCGIELEGREYRGPVEDPGEFFTPCADCDVRPSSEMTNEEIVHWFAQQAGFEPSGGPAGYLKKEALVEMRDWALELMERPELEDESEEDEGR